MSLDGVLAKVYVPDEHCDVKEVTVQFHSIDTLARRQTSVYHGSLPPRSLDAWLWLSLAFVRQGRAMLPGFAAHMMQRKCQDLSGGSNEWA